MTALAVLRLPGLPERPDAEAEADRGGEVAAHPEELATRVDRLGGHGVDLRAKATGRRGRLREGMPREGETHGKRGGEHRYHHPPQGDEAAPEERPLPGVREFHAGISWLRGISPSQRRLD